MKIFLNSYRPLIRTAAGRAAVAKHSIPPFVDGSCRREPDFEARFPGISAICRFRHFAPRLREDDVVLYVTVKGDYWRRDARLWHLTALLKVLRVLPSHHEAAAWYRENSLPLPSNCLLAENPP